MTDAQRLIEKVPDPALRRLAETGAGTESVIVELDVPAPTVEVEHGGRPGGVGHFRMAEIRLPSEEDQCRAADVAERGRALLGEIAEEPPVTLMDNTAYTALLTGAGIAQLAASPLIRRIHPNRTLR